MNINGILNDQTTSFWLKNALKTALERDPVDAANDTEALFHALEQNREEVTIAGLIQLAEEVEAHRAVFPGFHKSKSECESIIIKSGKALIVVLKELKDNPGTSVTNAYEIIATLMVKEVFPKYDPNKIIWFEYYEDRPGEYDLVKMEWLGNNYQKPSWRYVINKELIDKLSRVVNK